MRGDSSSVGRRSAHHLWRIVRVNNLKTAPPGSDMLGSISTKSSNSVFPQWMHGKPRSNELYRISQPEARKKKRTHYEEGRRISCESAETQGDDALSRHGLEWVASKAKSSKLRPRPLDAEMNTQGTTYRRRVQSIRSTSVHALWILQGTNAGHVMKATIWW